MIFSLLFADGDHKFARPVVDYLTGYGLDVTYVDNGRDAMKKYKQLSPDVVLLDVAMPYISGYDVVREIRIADKTTPLLYITSLTSSENAVKGLRLGANDYIRKGVASMEEIAVRISAALRTRGKDERSQEITLSAATSLDRSTMELKNANGCHRLGLREFNLIYYLAVNPNTIVDRDFLYHHIWDDNINSDKYLNKSISRLRGILSSDADVSIASFRSNGIKLCVAEELY